MFEDFHFPSLLIVPTPVLSYYGMIDELKPFKPECAIVVDIGHSNSSSTAIMNGMPVSGSHHISNIGGRHLTNLLKEIVSYRTMDVSAEPLMVNDMKEKMCFVWSEGEHE